MFARVANPPPRDPRKGTGGGGWAEVGDLLDDEGEAPGEHVHEVGEVVGVRGGGELLDVHHVGRWAPPLASSPHQPPLPLGPFFCEIRKYLTGAKQSTPPPGKLSGDNFAGGR